MLLSVAQVGNPAVELQQLICVTYTHLQSLAAPIALIVLAVGLLVAMVARGSVRIVSFALVVVLALAILSFNDILGALGAGGGCPNQLSI